MWPPANNNHRFQYTICIPLLVLLVELSDLTSSQLGSTSSSRANFLSPQRQQRQLVGALGGETSSTLSSTSPRRFAAPLSDKENNLRLLAGRQQSKLVANGLSKRSESAFVSRHYDTQQQQNFNPQPTRVALDNKFIIKRDSAEPPATQPTNYYDDRSDVATSAPNQPTPKSASDDICSDRLCYGLPMGCLDRAPADQREKSRVETSGSLCSVLVTSKRLIDPYRPASRDIYFEIVALPAEGRNNYAAVGFSESGRMAGLVSECVQYRDGSTQLQVIKLAHSFNIAGSYHNVPATISSGIKNLGVSYENGYYQCRWVVESAVEFSYEDPNGTTIERHEDLGYKNYHILLASGEYDKQGQSKSKSGHLCSGPYSFISRKIKSRQWCLTTFGPESHNTNQTRPPTNSKTVPHRTRELDDSCQSRPDWPRKVARGAYSNQNPWFSHGRHLVRTGDCFHILGTLLQERVVGRQDQQSGCLVRCPPFVHVDCMVW